MANQTGFVTPTTGTGSGYAAGQNPNAVYPTPNWKKRKKGGRQGNGGESPAWNNIGQVPQYQIGQPVPQYPIGQVPQYQIGTVNGYTAAAWMQPPPMAGYTPATAPLPAYNSTVVHSPPMAGYTPATAPLPKWKTKKIRSPQTFGQWVNNPPTTPFLTVTNPAPLPKPAPTPLAPPPPVYSPFSSSYSGWGGGGGGYSGYERTPSWLQNLYNWNFKG